MKLRVLLSLLFIVITTFSAIHELEHIDGKHSSSSCLICTFSHNLASADNNTEFIDFELVYTKEIESSVERCTLHFKKTDNHSNAPPFLS
jgi:hypothetical protein